MAAPSLGSPAVVSDGVTYNYQQLQAQARSVAALLQSLNHQAGERVGFLQPPTFSYAAAMLGIWEHRGVAVPLSLHQHGDELAYTVRDAGCSLVLADPEYAPRLAQACPHVPVSLFDAKKVISTSITPNTSAREALPAPEDPALIIYTSGTTGWPKVGGCHSCPNVRTG